MNPMCRIFLGLVLLILSIDLMAANDPQLVMEEFMVPAADPGISLYVRNKHPQGRGRGQEGGPDPGGLVRGMGGRHLRDRSGRLDADAPSAARAQRRGSGRARVLGGGKPLYDPAGIRVPTFLVHAEWDADLPSYMLHAYFSKLTNRPYKRYVEIGEGTHTIIMEKNRMQLFQAVQQFLDEGLTSK